MAAFMGHGGICVASCYNKKCDDMRRAVRQFGHAMCVTYFPNEEEQFAMKYGGLVERYAKHASEVLVITGDNKEEGQWQKQEMELLRREGIPFQKLTLAEYEARFRWPQGGAVPSAPAAQKRRARPVLCLGLLLCLAALPFSLRALESCAEAANGVLEAEPGPVTLEEAEWQPRDLGLSRELLGLWLQSCETAAAPEGCREAEVLQAAMDSGSSRTLQDGTEERGFFEGEALRLGRRRRPDGEVREGLFGGARANSLQRGTCTDANGIVDMGTFVHGFEGELRLQSGRRTFPHGETQEGDFFTDKEVSRLRRGKATFTDGAVLEGDFDYDTARLARGTWTFPSGLVVEGEFDLTKNGLKKGSRRHPDGRVERVG